MHVFRFTKLWLTLGWILIVFIVLLSLWPERPHITSFEYPSLGRLGHPLAYLVLMLWFANIYPQRRQRLWLSAGFILMGVSLEFLQHMIPGRTFLYADMMDGIFGVVVGLFLAKTFLSTCLLHLDRWLVLIWQKVKLPYG